LITEKGISVIIPNYNGYLLLPQILPPLFIALTNTNLPYEVIISDDCSTDKSIQFLENNYPQIKIIRTNINKGFSPTINKGIFAAKYDLLFLLNSDVKLTANYFKNLLPYFEEEDTFGVMGRIIGWDNDEIQVAGRYPSFHGVKIKTSRNFIPVVSKEHDRLYSMFLCGANALVSKEKIIKLGGFDELFAPFYIEDVELSLRAWLLGWKCYYEHNSICRHKTSSSIKSKSSKEFIKMITCRNKMYLYALHLNGFKKVFWKCQLFIEAIIHLFSRRWWWFSSFKMFINQQHHIKRSKEKFKHLKEINNTSINLTNVMKEILASLKNRQIEKW
jgi:GT2 family glycosyltransferase